VATDQGRIGRIGPTSCYLISVLLM
jgi:hypothetical protein